MIEIAGQDVRLHDAMGEASSNALILVSASAVFAAIAHGDQKRKELGEPYIFHPLRVGKMAAQLEMDAAFIAAAHLHDVPEDTSTTLDTIKSLFPERTTTLVDVMTKWWQSSHPAEAIVANKRAYYDRILSTPDAPVLKLLDRIDNLYDFTRMARMAAPKSHKWAAKYYDRTQRDFKAIVAAVSDTPYRAAIAWYETAMRGLEEAL